VARPHGIRGEVKVHRFNPDSTLLLEQPAVWLRKGEGEARHVEIDAARVHGTFVLMTLRGVRSREDAEALRGFEVCVPRAALPEPDDDEVYHTDLIGLRAELDDGTVAGEVVDVLSYPSADCLLVRSDEGDREVPLLPPYVVQIDLEAGVVKVAHLEDFDLQRRRR
jgi:16S rRNA processing protein RimM